VNQDRDFLRTEPLGKLLFKLAIPTVAAQLINMLYNIVDRIFIGHIPEEGSMALTGVGVCMPVIMFVSAFAALISSGGAPRASIAMGSKDNDRAELILGNCFILQAVISIVLTAVLLIWHRELLLTFGASENTIDYASDYMKIYALGTIFVQLTLSMNAFITAQGFTGVAMISVLIGAVSNILLDPLFIFGFEMGVMGAAFATIISQSISCMWAILFLCGRKTRLHLRIQNFRIVPSVVFSCLALGLSTFVMQSSESVIMVCFNSSLLKYGGDIAVGAMTILSSVMQFAMLPLQGLGQGSQPIMSYNYGARCTKRVKDTYKLLLRSCLCYSVPLWILIMLFPGLFVSIFTPDPVLAEFAGPALRVYMAVMGIFGIQIACQMAFVSIGSALSSIAVAVVRKFVLLLPLIYIMPAVFTSNKTMSVFAAEPVADILAVSFTVILFSIQFRNALKALERREDIQ